MVMFSLFHHGKQISFSMLNSTNKPSLNFRPFPFSKYAGGTGNENTKMNHIIFILNLIYFDKNTQNDISNSRLLT